MLYLFIRNNAMSGTHLYDYIYCLKTDWKKLSKKPPLTKEQYEEMEKTADTTHKIMFDVWMGNLDKIMEYSVEDFNKCLSMIEDPIYFMAVYFGHIHILKHFKKINMSFDKTNMSGKNIYEIAISTDNVEMVKYIEIEIRPHIPNIWFIETCNDEPILCLIIGLMVGKTTQSEIYKYFIKKPSKEFIKIAFYKYNQLEIKFPYYGDVFVKSLELLFEAKYREYIDHKMKKYKNVYLQNVDDYHNEFCDKDTLKCTYCNLDILNTTEYLKCTNDCVIHAKCFMFGENYITCFVKKTLPFKCRLCDAKFIKESHGVPNIIEL